MHDYDVASKLASAFTKLNPIFEHMDKLIWELAKKFTRQCSFIASYSSTSVDQHTILNAAVDSGYPDKRIMAKQSSRCTFSTSSLHDLCFCKLIEEFDHYPPEMLSLLPPVQRKELLLYCPIISVCHLEQTCAFNDIDSDRFWDELLTNQKNRLGSYPFYDMDAHEALLCASHSRGYENYVSSNREKYFAYLTAMIFSGDHFSSHFTDRYGYGCCFKSGTPPPWRRDCPDDIVNCLVAYRKPNSFSEEMNRDSEEQLSESDSSDEGDSYSPLPLRGVFRQEYGELYGEVMKGKHIPARYSHYISKQSHYRLSDEDAISLMMNECNYYPKKLVMHEYERMYWKWSDENLVQLLTQFFSKLESLNLRFRQGKENISHDTCTPAIDESKRVFELVLNCCFNSPVLNSLVIADPARTDFLSKLAAEPCQLLKKLDIHYWRNFRDKIHHLEAFASVIASHSQLTEIGLRLDTDLDIDTSSFSCLFTSLIDFVQRPEFSKLSLHGQIPFSSHFRLLIDAFLKTSCSQPQEIHLHPLELAYSEASSVDLPVVNNKVPNGALEYKSLFVHDYCKVTIDVCKWLFSHQPLILKAFHFDAYLVNIMEYDLFHLLPPLYFPMEVLCDNSLFQTQELLLPIFHDLPSPVFQNLLHRQQLTKLSLVPNTPSEEFWEEEEPKPCSISSITSILSLQVETLTELIIPMKNYSFCCVSVESSADVERFGDALFLLRNYEVFSLCIPVLWKIEDVVHIDSLYKTWQRHGCKKLKSFRMGKFEYGFVLTDELARKLDKMGLVIQYTSPSTSTVSSPSPVSSDHESLASSNSSSTGTHHDQL